MGLCVLPAVRLGIKSKVRLAVGLHCLDTRRHLCLSTRRFLYLTTRHTWNKAARDKGKMLLPETELYELLQVQLYAWRRPPPIIRFPNPS